MKEIRTDRMVLRAMKLSDIDDVLELFADPVAMRFSISGVRDREQTRQWMGRVLESYERHGEGFRAAILNNGSRYVGHAGLLTQEVDGRSELEIAYWFLRKDWGAGLATEAARACRDHGFGTLHARRLVSLIVPDNVASIRVAEKAGLRRERETTWKGIEIRVYGLDRESWLAGKPRAAIRPA